MKNSKKYKRRRAIIIVTALLIFLLGALLIFEKLNNDTGPFVPEETMEEDKDKDIDKNEKEIKDIAVTPAEYTAYSGEIINLENFKIETVDNSGNTEELALTNAKISSESDFIKIENNEIIVSQEALTSDRLLVKVDFNGVIKDIIINIFNKANENLDENNVIAIPAAYDVLVNKKRNLPSDYVPEDLVTLDDIPTVLQNPEVNQLREVAYTALKELFAAAKDEENYSLYARSGYRSYNTQRDLYNSYVANNGQEAADKYSAKPGQSEHQTGLAMDITTEAMNYQLDATFGETKEGKWVSENAHRFGFIVRYSLGKEDITGYSYEPWHIRYIGKDIAKEVYESGLTLEEYFE